jgi:hypothetical protein
MKVQSRFGRPHRPKEIGVKQSFGLLDVCFLNRSYQSAPRVVDESVDSPGPVEHGSEARAHGVFVANVEANQLHISKVFPSPDSDRTKRGELSPSRCIYRAFGKPSIAVRGAFTRQPPQ